MRTIHSISSRHNPHVRRWTALLETCGVKQHQQCLVFGGRLGKELVRQPSLQVLEMLVASSDQVSKPFPFTGPVYKLAPELFHALDVFGTGEPVLVCRIPPLQIYDMTQKPFGLEILCPMGDPGNLGGMLRGCLAFGAERIILLRESVHPFHPKVIRASSGAVFSLNLHWGCSVRTLGRPEYARWITALDMEGTDIATWPWPKDIRLLIGEEGRGIPPDSFAHRITIRQTHASLPLNAGVAGNIALYAYRQIHPT